MESERSLRVSQVPFTEASKLGSIRGRKTKLAHVSGMIGLNTTKRPSGDDQPLPIVWNWIVRRDAQFSEGNGVEVYGSIDVGCPIIRTKKVSTKKREDNSENSE